MDLEKLINKSDLHREIISFFNENPSSIDTPRGISTWVRGDYLKVKDILNELADAGILIAHKASSTTGYSYTIDPKVIAKIKKVLGA